MAAGMGSRFGGLKQLELLGPHQKTLLHYSIYDAVHAGFDKIVFIIRESFAEAFREAVGVYAERMVETHYCFQEMERLPGNLPPLPREKPWGTGHAIWSAKAVINEPFIAINADDFYGRDAFVKMHQFIAYNPDNACFSLAGYRLAATLSENGSVSRGVCQANEEGYLTDIREMTKITREGVFIRDLATETLLDPESPVSMNFWGFTPLLFEEIEQQFIPFYEQNKNNPKAELYIPFVVNELLQKKKVKVKILKTNASWFGVTYKEDIDSVNRTLNLFDKEGLYRM